MKRSAWSDLDGAGRPGQAPASCTPELNGLWNRLAAGDEAAVSPSDAPGPPPDGAVLDASNPIPLMSDQDAAHPGDAVLPPPGRLGDSLVAAGRLTLLDVERIAEVQRARGLRFGDAAVSLGLLTSDEVRQALSLQYQYPTARADARLDGFPVASAPDSPEAEAIRSLRTRILLGLDPVGLQSVACMGPRGEEGAAYVASSLALAFAQNGQRTLLLNADLRESRHFGLLDPTRAQGLSSVLSGRSSLADAIVDSGFPHLHLLDAGPLPPNPAELLRAPGIAGILQQLSEGMDMVVLNMPPVIGFPDAQIVARQIGACILVARRNRTLLGDMKSAQQQLATAGGRLLGCVYNAAAQ